MEKLNNYKLPTVALIGVSLALSTSSPETVDAIAPIEQYSSSYDDVAFHTSTHELPNDAHIPLQVKRHEAQVPTFIAAPKKATVVAPKKEKIQSTPSLPASTIWFGKQSLYKSLSAEGKRNAQILFTVESALGRSTAEIGCLDNIAYKESHLQTGAVNKSSGAGGIPQALPESKMSSAGPNYRTNAATQIKWMDGYVESRYGGACQAWNFWQNHSWY